MTKNEAEQLRGLIEEYAGARQLIGSLAHEDKHNGWRGASTQLDKAEAAVDAMLTRLTREDGQ